MCLHIFLSSDLSTAKLSGIKAALNHQNTGGASEGQCPVEVLARTHTSKANLNSYSLPFMDFCCKCICLKKRGTKSNLYDPELQQSGWSMQPFSSLFCVSVCVSIAVCTCGIVLAGIETRPWSCHRNQKLWISAAAPRPVVGEAQEKTR